jgi:hypothetical protein
MGYKLELDLPNVGKGVEVYLDGLGFFENGKDYEITDEQADAFRVAHQEVTYHTDPDNGMVTHTTEEPGPTVLEYFKSHEGVTVSSDKKVAKKAAAPPQGGNSAPVEGEGNKDAGDGSNDENKGGDGQ